MNVSRYSKSSFDGGLNDTVTPRELKSNECNPLSNWDIRYQGELRRRDGLTQVGNTPTAVPAGIHGFARTNGNNDLLIMDDGSLKYLNGASFSALDSGFTAGNEFAFETISSLNRVYISNEDNTTHYWDRASTTLNSCLTDLGATCYQANKMIWFKNHLFFLNNLKVGATSYADWVGFSDFNAPDTHDTTNARFQVGGQGRIITAIDLGDSLVLFKEHSIHFLQGYGEASWAITASSNNVANLSEAVGCIALKGVCRVGNEAWFIDDEGYIRRITQTDFDAFRQDIISTKVQGSLALLNKSQLEKVAMWSNDDYVFVSYPTGASLVNDTVLRFDLITYRRSGEEAWTKITGWHAKAFTDYISSTQAPDLMVLDGSSGKVYKHSGTSDDGVAIDAVATDFDNDDKAPSQYKRYRWGEISAETASSDATVSIHASVDGSTYAKLGDLSVIATGSHLAPTGTDRLAPTGSFRLAGNAENELRFHYTEGGGTPTGRSIRHSIRHSVLNEQPSVRTYDRFYKLRDPR